MLTSCLHTGTLAFRVIPPLACFTPFDPHASINLPPPLCGYWVLLNNLSRSQSSFPCDTGRHPLNPSFLCLYHLFSRSPVLFSAAHQSPTSSEGQKARALTASPLAVLCYSHLRQSTLVVVEPPFLCDPNPYAGLDPRTPPSNHTSYSTKEDGYLFTTLFITPALSAVTFLYLARPFRLSFSHVETLTSGSFLISNLLCSFIVAPLLPCKEFPVF